MENTEQTTSTINEAISTLTSLGYDTFSKRIVNHSEFTDNFKFTYWSSAERISEW